MPHDSRPAVLELIGNTPLVRVSRFDPFLDALPEDVAHKVARDNFLAILPKPHRDGDAP